MHRAGVVPGHQVVGTVTATASAVHQVPTGDRVGIAWLRRTCGACRWCREGRENLCPSVEYTGWDADGGFADYTTVPEAFAYPLPLDAAIVFARRGARPGGTAGHRAWRHGGRPPGRACPGIRGGAAPALL